MPLHFQKANHQDQDHINHHTFSRFMLSLNRVFHDRKVIVIGKRHLLGIASSCGGFRNEVRISM